MLGALEEDIVLQVLKITSMLDWVVYQRFQSLATL